MAGSGPHETSPHHAESANAHQQGSSTTSSMEMTWTTNRKAACRHSTLVEVVIKEEVTQYMSKLMQREIDDLKKRLRRAQRKQIPSSSDSSSNDEGDVSYRQRSGTPPSESFSCEEENSHKRRRRSPSGRGVGTNVMKKALSQISKSPFTRGIEKAKLPRRFHQPTFAMYNGRTDLVEHVSQFKQKMAVHSQDETLLC